jgi:hypothetical protein
VTATRSGIRDSKKGRDQGRDGRSWFCIGERQRRYDFYKKTLGWDPPPGDRADTYIQNSGEEIQKAAAKLAPGEPDYYAHKGPPSTQRLFSCPRSKLTSTRTLLR